VRSFFVVIPTEPATAGDEGSTRSDSCLRFYEQTDHANFACPEKTTSDPDRICVAEHDPPWAARAGEFHWYAIYGIVLRSQIQLSFPQTQTGRHSDIDLLTASPRFFEQTICGAVMNPSPTRWYKYAQLDNGQSYLRWDGLFEFLVDSDGRPLTARRSEG
jgi:hypothetical protein